jgi:hypothetical protein
MVFGQPMLRTEISIAVLTLKRENLFGATVLTLHCSSLTNAVRLFLALQFKCLLSVHWLLTPALTNTLFSKDKVALSDGGIAKGEGSSKTYSQ